MSVRRLTEDQVRGQKASLLARTSAIVNADGELPLDFQNALSALVGMYEGFRRAANVSDVRCPWCGEPLCLQLDHLDGNRDNNSRDNLRFLCPNCHSQTGTFAGKNAYTRDKRGD